MPAMQTPRYIRHTEAMPSQASQLLQWTVPASAFDLAFNTQAGFQAAVLLLLILGAPLNHAGRTQALERG
ncbi:hypothetical protein C1X89_28795 [Pseudomonas sp. GP01-A8]|nr:hypothetical protein C1X90_27130 [Pseudomonas sp. GP01-A9]PMU26248.1 hypothetical protein C1X88_22020 [Pseudomonas sp. GP01-A13]PMU33327.1 hypothetical protein C1X89_28795 [Pseudomonas sp. GP01-A8]PMU50091.1 hypothetical protein C1X85_25285 [Pseudomonas sp. GP01-A6]PMU59171.1 hypothetical protein C1X86_30080 [Pseudomonas sp. GP01-A3]PMU65053.1 hypothetical protein C1X84_34915 [Pseudomonas sp. GP01-A1]PMU98766.1 hypothetical protein C1X83_34970 [Pseudomonas sp. GP01-A4]PMX66023.1 hypotheti